MAGQADPRYMWSICLGNVWPINSVQAIANAVINACAKSGDMEKVAMLLSMPALSLAT